MLYNGFGEHNIQGIGDKHVRCIHNVMNTDVVVGVSDHATDPLLVLFNTDAAARYLATRAACARDVLAALAALRPVGHLQHAGRHQDRARRSVSAPEESIITVATDGAAMYGSEARRRSPSTSAGSFDERAAAEIFGRAPARRATTDHLLELDHARAQADLQPRLLHLGRAAGCLARGIRGARQAERSGRSCSAASASLGRR